MTAMGATMTGLDPWVRRPVEEANLFNPPFLCALTYEFLKAHGNGAPITLAVIALATSLHRLSRERLPYSTVSSLYEWLQGNGDLLIGFAMRARGITPYVKEAILFGMSLEALAPGNAHDLQLGMIKAAFPKSFIDAATPETKDIIDRTKFMGRWFAKSGSEVTIAAAWGVKP
jgi:Family of unknown function (DUF6521)